MAQWFRVNRRCSLQYGRFCESWRQIGGVTEYIHESTSLCPLRRLRAFVDVYDAWAILRNIRKASCIYVRIIGHTPPAPTDPPNSRREGKREEWEGERAVVLKQILKLLFSEKLHSKRKQYTIVMLGGVREPLRPATDVSVDIQIANRVLPLPLLSLWLFRRPFVLRRLRE